MNTIILICTLAVNSPKMVCRASDEDLKPLDNTMLVIDNVNKAFRVVPLDSVPLPSDHAQSQPTPLRR